MWYDCEAAKQTVSTQHKRHSLTSLIDPTSKLFVKTAILLLLNGDITENFDLFCQNEGIILKIDFWTSQWNGLRILAVKAAKVDVSAAKSDDDTTAPYHLHVIVVRYHYEISSTIAGFSRFLGSIIMKNAAISS